MIQSEDGDKGTQNSLGLGWWIFISALLVVAILLLSVPISSPEWLARMIPKVQPPHVHILFAIFLLASCVNHILSHWLSLSLSKLYKLDPCTKRENLYPPAIIGLLESMMYPIFFLADKPEYIGAWVALKVAGGWKKWQDTDEGRRRFNKFLIGNAFTVAVAFVTYGIIFSSIWMK